MEPIIDRYKLSIETNGNKDLSIYLGLKTNSDVTSSLATYFYYHCRHTFIIILFSSFATYFNYHCQVLWGLANSFRDWILKISFIQLIYFSRALTATDGISSNDLHFFHSVPSDPFPWLQIDLGKNYAIHGIRFLPRKNDFAGHYRATKITVIMSKHWS